MPGCQHLQGVTVPAAQNRGEPLRLLSFTHTMSAIVGKVQKGIQLACRLM